MAAARDKVIDAPPRRGVSRAAKVARFAPPACETGIRIVDPIGVQLAQVLTVVAAVAVVWVLCQLALGWLCEGARPARPVPAVAVRQPARRATWRQVADAVTPLPSRDPPRFPRYDAAHEWQGSDPVDRFGRLG